ncbi:MAG TPA: MBL fold metallo-hydrolase [Chthoniobacteraceae bacterium]|nr:MBL fold metallo-hydrolase [Chthoniobacteraceae bacterium]
MSPVLPAFSVTILGSGSAGNSALVEAGSCRVLVDGGLSARQISRRLEAIGVDPCSLDAILLTHEHCDHVAGLRVFCKKKELPVYCTRLTAEALGRELGEHRHLRQFQPGSDFSINGIEVHAFSVPHDAVDPVGFVFGHGGERLGFLTDLGVCTRLALERVRGARTLVIETNHDEKLLQQDTRRPWSLKQRIMSRHGHLSNRAAAEVVAELFEHGLERAVLGHLSRDCNTPELALGAIRSRLAEAGASPSCVELHCASQDEPSPRFGIARRQAEFRLHEIGDSLNASR